MSAASLSPGRSRWDRRLEIVVVVLAIVVAAGSAEPYSFSPNDGSRLATVEALVDHGTLAIDRSIFVKPPPESAPAESHGYHPLAEPLRSGGTVDKVIVRGRFYSDKPPVPNILLAGWYWFLQVTVGLHANERADIFCYLMALGSSGLCYVISLWAAYRLGRALSLNPVLCVGLAASLGLATMAGAYVRAVNGHIQQLAIAVVVIWLLERLRQQGPATRPWRLVLLGSLGGLGYAIEQPTGGLLLAAIGVLVLWHIWRWHGSALPPGQAFQRDIRAARQAGKPDLRVWGGILWLTLGCLPWLAFHHGVTYAIAGTWKPINSVPEFFDYPGCEFSATNMTGRWNHPDFASCAYYGWQLLFDERGFVAVNFPLHLALLAVPLVWWRGRAWRPELLALGGWCVGTWLVYTALSTNFSGACRSVRWFLPLLAVGVYVLALLVRLAPRFQAAFWAINGCGVIQGWWMWRLGPWCPYTTPMFTLLIATTWSATAAAMVWGLLPWASRGAPKLPGIPSTPILPAESFGFAVPVNRHNTSGPEGARITDLDLAAAHNGRPAVDHRTGRTAS